MPLGLRFCCCMLFYSLCLLLRECKAGRDSAEPIELISDIDFQNNHGTPKVDMQNDRPSEPEMQQVFKFIEEKFLSFAALNIRPNFANIFRHMERMARAFVRLNARVDQMYVQVEEIKTHHHNCSSGGRTVRSEKTFEDMEKRIEQLEKQTQFSPTSIDQQLQQLQEHMQRMESKLDEVILEKNVYDINQRNAFNSIDFKIDTIRNNLSEIMYAQHESRKEIRSNMLNIQEMNHALNNLQHHCKTEKQISNYTSNHEESSIFQHELHNKFNTIVHHLDLQQHLLRNVTHVYGTLLSNNHESQQMQQEKITELLDIMQDLPGIVTDAVDKMEMMSDKLQFKLDANRLEQDSDSDTSFSLQKVEANTDSLIRAINEMHKPLSGNVSIEELINAVQTLTAELRNPSKAATRDFMNNEVLNVRSTGNTSTIQEMMHKMDVGNKLLQNVYAGIKDLKSHIPMINTTVVPISGNSNSEVFLRELHNIEMGTNITIDKLNFIISHLSFTQLEHANTGLTLEFLTNTGTNLENEMQKLAGDVESIKLLIEELVNSNRSNSKLNGVENQAFMQMLNDYLNNKEIKATHNPTTSYLSTNPFWDSSNGNTQNEGVEHSKQKQDNLNEQCILLLTGALNHSKQTDESFLLPQMNENLLLILSKLEHFVHNNNQLQDSMHDIQSKFHLLSDSFHDPPTSMDTASTSSECPPLLLTALRGMHNYSLENNKEIHFKIDQLTELLIAKMQFILEQSSDLRTIKNMLQNPQDQESDQDQDYSSQSWGSSSLSNARDVQNALKEKVDQLRSAVQVAVDEGLLQVIDILGQNKQWFQQEMTKFLNQQSEDVNKMKGSTTLLLTKGFDNLQFMYQYLSGKLDKIHQIAAHNLEDCADIQRSGHSTNGIYTIYPRNSKEIKVYCDMDSNGIGWTVIQRRGQFGSGVKTSFNESWINYKYGFGNLEQEFWLGNEKIHTLTNQGNYVLRIEFVYAQPDKLLPRYKRKFWHDLRNGSHLHAHYSHFIMKGEDHNYSIAYTGYLGIHPYDGFDARTEVSFATYDHYTSNHDQYCTKVQGGGWWYGTECFRFALNSKYKAHYWEDGNVFTGITWGGTADVALLQHVEMKILPHKIFQRMLAQNTESSPTML